MKFYNYYKPVIFALSLFLIACSAGRGGGQSSGGTTEYQFGDTVTVDGEQVPKLDIILLHDTTQPEKLLVGTELSIRAKLVDYTHGSTAPDVLVDFEIIENISDNIGGGDGQLTSKSVYSDEEGLVENTFYAGTIGSTHYTVKLSALGAEDRYLDIQVVGQPSGDLEVLLGYEGPINVNTIKVRLMPKSFNCGTFNPTYNIQGALFEKTVLSIDAKPYFSGLTGGAHFTLVATAKSPAGSLAAAACKDGVFVTANETNTTTLNLYLLPLNPAGNYDVENVFDFTKALPEMGTVGEVIQGVVTLFNDPGKFLIDQIKKLVKQFIGEAITEIAFGLFEDELADVITDWVKNDSPSWVQDFFTIGDDLTQVVDHLQLLSVLKISKLTNDYYVQGIQYWNAIVLQWKYGCDPNAPDFEQCGVYEFSMEEFNNTQFPQDILEGQFTASIVNYDQLYIDNHVIKLSYGKLILFVLNEMILKTLTGENTLKGAAIKFVNCDGIANSFSNGVLDAIGITEEKLADSCKSVVGFMVAPLENWIGELALDSQLRLQGHCTMADSTDDLVVDLLLDGEYTGTIEIENGAGPTFTGTFEGVRQQAP